MKQWLLLIPSILSALTWGELEQNNAEKVGRIERLFLQAIRETGAAEAALALMGSYSYGIALADSDLEFALLIPSGQKKETIFPLVDRFYSLCEKEGIFWDRKGWHPPTENLLAYPSSPDLLATPAELNFLRLHARSVTLRYALYNPKFGGGSRLLYEEFFSHCPQKRKEFGSVIADEYEKTRSAMKRTIYHAKILKQLYLGRKGAGGIGVQEETFTVKGRWIKPTVELLQYLIMERDLYPENLFEGISLLEREGVLDAEFAERIRRQLIFEIELRERFGMIVSTRDLTDEEIQKLYEGASLLTKLADRVVKRKPLR